MFGMPDLTLKEFKGIRKGDLHRTLQEEGRKMDLPLNRDPSKSNKGLFSRALPTLLRPLRKMLPRLRPS